jgi:hypothetical protein
MLSESDTSELQNLAAGREKAHSNAPFANY